MVDEEKPPQEPEELSAEEEEKLPFPTARVVRIIKENFEKEHQIKSEVKVAANELLGKILVDIAKSLDKEEFYTLTKEHFDSASRKYRAVDLQKKRIERIKRLLEKQKAEIEEVLLQIEVEEGV